VSLPAAIAEIDRLAGEEADADDILRGVVALLVDPGGCSWAGVLFVEGETLVLGPEAGIANPGARNQIPVVFESARVAELAVDDCQDDDFLDRVAAIIAPFCLVGWDTDGEPWEP